MIKTGENNYDLSGPNKRVLSYQIGAVTQVYVEIRHPRVGDLIIDLALTTTPFTVRLLDRPGIADMRNDLQVTVKVD